MKKTLAIVLALVMVLCMIPAVAADSYVTKTVENKQYDIKVTSDTNPGAFKTGVTSYTHEYNFENEVADGIDKWTDATKMATVEVKGFDTDVKGADSVVITIDGKKLDADANWNKTEGKLTFPVQLTKAGYSDTYLISLKFVNTAAYKDAKTANILDVESSDKKSLDAYIVGSKLYLDFVDEAAAGKMGETIAITFGDENKTAFTGATWAYKPTNMDIANATYNNFGDEKWGYKLKDSTAKYFFADIDAANGAKVSFPLETASALYATKEYTVVIRKGIKASDPKGVIFQDSTKTIAMGETYAPKLVGVANGKVLTPDALAYGTNTSEQVIDIDGVKVIGTREGVAYITASYKADKTGIEYTSNSMKIVVTTGESIPPVVKTEVYYVTCRNLNVRKGAGTSYAKAGMIHRGDAVEVVEIKGGWAKLANGTYVCAKYIAK